MTQQQRLEKLKNLIDSTEFDGEKTAAINKYRELKQKIDNETKILKNKKKKGEKKLAFGKYYFSSKI